MEIPFHHTTCNSLQTVGFEQTGSYFARGFELRRNAGVVRGGHQQFDFSLFNDVKILKHN